MGHVLTGDQLRVATKRIGEIQRQLGQAEYPYDPEGLKVALQAIVDGRFGNSTLLTIDRAKPFNPAKFIGKGWTIWRGPADGDGLSGADDQDERSLALTTVDLGSILLETTLKPSDNGRVNGEEKLRRLKAEGLIRLDAGIFQTLWENKNRIPESWKTKNAVYFDGTVLRNPVGCRYVLDLCWYSGGWRWGYRWLGYDWSAEHPSAVLAK